MQIFLYIQTFLVVVGWYSPPKSMTSAVWSHSKLEPPWYLLQIEGASKSMKPKHKKESLKIRASDHKAGFGQWGRPSPMMTGCCVLHSLLLWTWATKIKGQWLSDPQIFSAKCPSLGATTCQVTLLHGNDNFTQTLRCADSICFIPNPGFMKLCQNDLPLPKSKETAHLVRATQHLCRQGSQVMSSMSSWTSRAQTMAMAMGWVTSAPVAPVAVAPMAVVTVVRPTATGTMAVVWVSMVRGGIQNMGMTRSVMTVTIEEAAEDRMPLGSTGWMKSVRNVQAPLCCLGPRANWERSGNWHKAK